MGLKSLVQEIMPVFSFLGNVWSALPNMVQFLIYIAFGIVILLAVMRSLWG